ncbi:DUF4932 domain-containing protein [Prevotella sp. 10(H)]|uniref:DUF4932 domain-containing protein n=1 Tax=Prevotella sp. 10(H) TaxID=1158294 RepID=UPI00069098FA|nr:DUF4932 domain-containing protein [Prevotella sp. 10(H)]
MSRILLVILATLCFQACVVKEEKKVVLERPTADKRVELLNIVFRLAEAPGYSFQDYKPYVDRIEQYFGKYKDHELIQYTKSILKENETDWDAVAKMAIRLDDNMVLMTGVSDVWQADARWSKETAEKFVSLLPQFVKDTEFDNFFRDNADLYTAAADRFVTVCEQVNMDWYGTFYGNESSGEFLIIMALGSGPSCYGVTLEYADGGLTAYAIMGVWKTDDEGMPLFDNHLPYSDTPVLPILLHEFNHSFVNHVTEKYKDSFQESGEKIASILKSKEKMAGHYYWKTVFDEALVRACVIKYMKDNGFAQPEIDKEIKFQKEWWGFVFIEELVSELESYDRQRDTYPTFESYMPKLVEFYNALPEKI